MVHQTDNDSRLKVAELALAKLNTSIFSKSTVRPGLSKEATNNLLSKIESQLMAIKYCYMEPDKLAASDMIIEIHESAKQLYLGYSAFTPTCATIIMYNSHKLPLPSAITSELPI